MQPINFMLLSINKPDYGHQAKAVRTDGTFVRLAVGQQLAGPAPWKIHGIHQASLAVYCLELRADLQAVHDGLNVQGER